MEWDEEWGVWGGGGGRWTKLSVAQLRIVRWLETVGVEFVRVEAEEDATGSGRSRPKGVVEEDVVQSLCDGVQV